MFYNLNIVIGTQVHLSMYCALSYLSFFEIRLLHASTTMFVWQISLYMWYGRKYFC